MESEAATMSQAQMTTFGFEVFNKIHKLPEGYELNPKMFSEILDWGPEMMELLGKPHPDGEVFPQKAEQHKRATATPPPTQFYYPEPAKGQPWRTHLGCRCPVAMTLQIYQDPHSDINTMVDECKTLKMERPWHVEAKTVLRKPTAGKNEKGFFPMAMYKMIQHANKDYDQHHPGEDNIWGTLLAPLLRCTSGMSSVPGLTCMVAVGNMANLMKGPYGEELE